MKKCLPASTVSFIILSIQEAIASNSLQASWNIYQALTLAPILNIIFLGGTQIAKCRKAHISHPPSKTDVTAQIDGSMSQKLYASSELRHVYVK